MRLKSILHRRHRNDDAKPQTVTPIYRTRRDLLAAHPPTGEIAFVGDSHVQLVDWNTLLPGRSIANYGIGGDTISGVLGRLQPIVSHPFRQVVVMAGVNDLFLGREHEEVGRDALAIEAALHPKPLLVVSVFPVSGKNAALNPRIAKTNAHLASLFKGRYIDVAPSLGGATLGSQYTSDDLHLSLHGYDAVAAALAPIVT